MKVRHCRTTAQGCLVGSYQKEDLEGVFVEIMTSARCADPIVSSSKEEGDLLLTQIVEDEVAGTVAEATIRLVALGIIVIIKNNVQYSYTTVLTNARR